jgi:hypothetical protein
MNCFQILLSIQLAPLRGDVLHAVDQLVRHPRDEDHPIFSHGVDVYGCAQCGVDK